MILDDAFLGNDYSVPEYKYKFFVNLPLYLTLPVLIGGLILLAWFSSSGESDLFSIGAIIKELTGLDAIANKEATKWYHLVGGTISMGFLTGGYGINVGHELTHRTWDKFAWIWGRWILAASNTTDFSIEHVYGHHETVGTLVDPATARRGENVYKFIFRSITGSLKNAWILESKRLKKKNLPVFSHHNQYRRGIFMSLTFVAFFIYAGGNGLVSLYICFKLFGRELHLKL